METFEDYCRMKFIDCDSKGSKAITKAKGEKVIRLLKNQGDLTDCTPKFRHWVKSKKFQLIWLRFLPTTCLHELLFPTAVQIHFVNDNHWVVSSFTDGFIKLYDSLSCYYIVIII